jgi:hypothetical protein
MPQTPINDFSKLVIDAEKTLRDGAYVALGLGILGFQQAQVRRHELTKRFGSDAATGRAQLSELAKTVEERIAPVRKQLDEQVGAIEETLPPAAKKVVGTVRSAASDAEARLRTLVGRSS